MVSQLVSNGQQVAETVGMQEARRLWADDQGKIPGVERYKILHDYPQEVEAIRQELIENHRKEMWDRLAPWEKRVYKIMDPILFRLVPEEITTKRALATIGLSLAAVTFFFARFFPRQP